MPRFTLYRSESAPEQDATEQIQSVGARIIAERPGLALIETTDEGAEQLRGRLRNWKVTKEALARQNPPRPRPGRL